MPLIISDLPPLWELPVAIGYDGERPLAPRLPNGRWGMGMHCTWKPT